MALTVQISINVAPGDRLTDFELGILRACAGSTTPEPSINADAVDTPQSAQVAPIKTGKTSTKAATQKTEAEVAPEVDDDAPTAKATLEQAVSRATALVSKGKTETVKEALAAVGAKKVSELKGTAIAAFIEALDV